MQQASSMYSETTAGIRISVRPAPLQESSDPPRGVYAFSYTVKIENVGTVPAQLMERHWIIYSGGVQMAEVMGPGVVGEQPMLAPGESYEYTSGAVIQDPIGTMHGTYTFRAAGGREFEVTIPKFDLLYPMNLH